MTALSRPVPFGPQSGMGEGSEVGHGHARPRRDGAGTRVGVPESPGSVLHFLPHRCSVMHMTQTAAPATHRIRWWVVVDGQRIPHTATMRGPWPGYDATCSCGWDTRTGGAVRNYIRREVESHKWDHAVQA